MLASAAKATHAQTRRHNNRLVFQRVYEQGPLSRADIARATNLTATTVSTVIGELLEEGLVAELGAISIERGKPPTLVSLAKDARHILALDLSRKTFQGSILNLRGEIQLSRRAVAEVQGDAALTVIYGLIDELMAQTTTPLLGIGLGAPGVIDPNSGLIRRAANLDWYDVPLGDLISQRYGCHVQVVNDNQAALLAEYLFGEYKRTPDLVVVRIGNGIGAGIMCNGQLLHGNGGGVGEIGHVTVVEQGERCNCGNDGCLETVASSRALVKQAQALARSDPYCRLNLLVESPEAITIETVLQAFHQGDAAVTALVVTAGEQLGKVLAHLVSVLGPPRILLCGSLAGFGPGLIEVIQQEVTQRCLIGRLSAPEISQVTLTSELSDLVVMGAAATILANELGLFW